MLNGMRVLVTGASGFIGEPTCGALMQRGMQVRASVRGGKILPKGVELAYIDEVGPDTDWRAALNEVDVIVHLAGRAHVLPDPSLDSLSLFRRTNTQGTLNLAQQAVITGVKRFVFVSSIGVNGAVTTQLPFTPDDVPAPHSPYAQSKYEAELGLSRLASETDLEVVIIRPPLVYGPRVPGNFKVLLRWVLRGLPLPLGLVRNQRSFVGLDNLVDFIALCADREKSPRAANEIFLISDDEDICTPDLLRKVARAYNKPLCLLAIPPCLLRLGAKLLGKSALAERLLDSLVIDNTKASNLLGWRPVASIDQQLQKMAQVEKAA